MTIAHKKPIFILLLTLLFTSCISKYSTVELETNIPIALPFAHGTYTLGDLFYNLDDTVVVKTGNFYELNDTIAVNESSLVANVNQVEILFQSTNYMPFQVDLEIIPFDTLTNIGGNKIALKLIEPASINEQLSIAMPVYLETSVALNNESLTELRNSNSMLIIAKFIWPYETITAPIISELPAFDLNIVIKAEL